MPTARQAGDRLHRPVGVRQVHPAAGSEPDVQLYPGQRATGEVLIDGDDILSPEQDLNLLRARIGMVFQKPTPFPMSIYRQHRLRHPPLRAAAAARSWTTGSRRRCAAPPSGTRSRTSSSRAASASRADSSSACASPARSRSARGPAAGRALLGARPDRDRPDRGADRRAAAELHIVIVTHNMQQAARVSTTRPSSISAS